MGTTFCCTGKGTKEKGLGKADLQCAATPLATIDTRARDNNTRSPRGQGSDGRRLHCALTTRVAERRATSSGWIGLRYEALINSGPSARATASSTWQRVTGGFPYHTPTTMGLLHASRQRGIIMTPHRAGVPCVRDATRRQTLGPLWAPSRLARWRRVSTVVRSRGVKHSFIYGLYTLCQHPYKVRQEVRHRKGCLGVSCELHMPSHLRWTPLQWGWGHGSRHHTPAGCKSQGVRQHVVEGEEEGQRGKKGELTSRAVLLSLSETCD